MRGLAAAIMVLASAGCTPSGTQDAGNESANIVENVTVIENKTLEYQILEPERPVTNEVTPDNVTTEAAAGANGLPADVQRFVERREGCEHWAGEPDYDEARRKQIEEAVRELCPGVDSQLASLRKTYADNPRVMAALADFEPLGMDE